MDQRDYYCNNKFKFLKIDLERKTTYNCHAARPHKIDFNWLKNNPGNLFNTDINVSERSMMLENIRNSSCEQNCWRAEDAGAVGPRILEKGYEKTHFNVRTQPEIIDLTISSECNLTCSYCCKEYSSSWRKDIEKNGDYVDLDDGTQRYNLINDDRILQKLSQKEKISSQSYQAILSEFDNFSNYAKRLIITGGEPLLNNSLFDILEKTKKIPSIKLFTGLGVNPDRLKKIVDKLAAYPNVYVCISIENLGKFYEFNRYGMSWSAAESNIDTISKSGVRADMHATLTNLTLFGFAEFYNRYKDSHKIEFDLAYNPFFMSASVLDDVSKTKLIDELGSLGFQGSELLLQTLKVPSTNKQKTGIRDFLKQFVARRPDLNINIFPKSFLTWMDNHVV